MSDIPFHAHSDIFPFMDSNAFDTLRTDLYQNGMANPIVLLDGKILDGRNRYRAMRFLHPEFSPENNPNDFTVYSGDKPLEYVISCNLHRRHLNESQRSIIAAKISLANPGKNRFQKGVSSPKAAALMNVSTGLVNSAKRLIKTKPEAVASVEAGEERVGRFNDDGCISAAIGIDLRNRFGLLCSDLGRSNADVLTDLVRMAVDGTVKLERSKVPFVIGRNSGRPRAVAN